MLKKEDMRVLTAFDWLKQVPGADYCEDGNDTAGSIKDGIYLPAEPLSTSDEGV
jgi:hypothetical protein